MTTATPIRVNDESLTSASDLSAFIRDLTQAEIDTFNRDGWVYVPGFVKPALCDMIIDRYAQWSGLHWREWPSDPAEQRAFIATVDKFAAKPKWHFAIR